MSFWFDKTKNRWRIRIRRAGLEFAETLPPGAGRAQAEERHAKLTREHYNRTKLDRSSHTVAEALEKLIKEALPAKSGPEVIGHIEALTPWVRDRPLTEIADVARDYRAEARKKSRKKNDEEKDRVVGEFKPATINRRLSVLRRVANLAWEEWHWLDRPIKIHLLPENNERHYYLTEAQLRRLARACSLPETRDMVMIAAYTGQRRTQVKNLRPSQVITIRDERGRRLKVIDFGLGKNGQPNRIPVHPAIESAVRRGPFGHNARWIHTDFKRAAAKIGMPHINFHDLRHTTASLLISSGAGEGTVADILAHRDRRSTRRYSHLWMEAKRKAIERLR